MRRTIAIACVLATIPGMVLAQQPNPHSPPMQRTDVAKDKQKPSPEKSDKPVSQANEVPAQTMPPIPATLMNSPPVKPSVTMEHGLLTIDAPNSTLSDVLSGVRRATGAAIEGASPNERVAVKLGPGDPEQVIAALLRGTPYNYVILGALGKQDVVTRVLLTQSSQGASSFSPTPSGGQPPAQDSGGAEMHSPREVQQQPEEDNQQPDDTAPQPNAGGEPDQAQQPQQQQEPQQQPAQQQDQNQPKTPEQLFKELQQLQQQKQQQSQQPR